MWRLGTSQVALEREEQWRKENGIVKIICRQMVGRLCDKNINTCGLKLNHCVTTVPWTQALLSLDTHKIYENGD